VRLIEVAGAETGVDPSQVEEVLHQHPAVSQACVIGVPDIAQVERVKAFVVLKKPEGAGEDMASALIAHCREHLIKWACPREIEFRATLPVTRLGKVDFKTLIQEELRRRGEPAPSGTKAVPA
jgi:acyl-coenzyme A synthetase/AMP-(fatty) acid ligase